MLPLLLPVAVALVLSSPDPEPPIAEAVSACGAREPTVIVTDDGHSLLIHADPEVIDVQGLIFCLANELELPTWLAYQIALTPEDVNTWSTATAMGYTATWIAEQIIIYDETTLAPNAEET
jgi:hypothetical protein